MSEIDGLGPKPRTVPTQGTAGKKQRQTQRSVDKKLRKKGGKKPPPSDHQVDEYV